MRSRRDIPKNAKKIRRRRKVRLPRKAETERLEPAHSRIPTPADNRTAHVVSVEKNISGALGAVVHGKFALEDEIVQDARRHALGSLNHFLEHGGFSPNQRKLCHRMIGLLEENFTVAGMREFLRLSCGLKGKTI